MQCQERTSQIHVWYAFALHWVNKPCKCCFHNISVQQHWHLGLTLQKKKSLDLRYCENKYLLAHPLILILIPNIDCTGLCLLILIVTNPCLNFSSLVVSPPTTVITVTFPTASRHCLSKFSWIFHFWCISLRQLYATNSIVLLSEGFPCLFFALFSPTADHCG